MGAVQFSFGDRWLTLREGTIEQAEVAPASDCQALNELTPGSIFNLSVVQALGGQGDVQMWRRYLLAEGGGTTSVDENDVVCSADRAYVIVGPFVACLAVDTGELIWARQCDDSICFDIHALLGTDDLMVRGELEIVRLSPDGSIRWSAGARDIFTGPFVLGPDAIIATDFNGDVYKIDHETGESIIVGKGKPYPH